MHKQRSLLISLLFLCACSPYNREKQGPHYHDGKFWNLNPSAIPKKGPIKFLKWRLFSKRSEWPKWVKIAQDKAPTRKEHDIVVHYINHATTLIQTQELNILTDPIWSERPSPVSFAGPKRVKLPGVAFENLPKIDIVLIGHNHYDHMDLPTLKRLNDQFSPQFYVGLGSKELLANEGIKNIHEMNWYDELTYKGTRIIFLPVQHWSKRQLFYSNQMLWGGFAILKDNFSLYFASDTGYANHFKLTHKLTGDIDLCLLPIGAYAPRWFMRPSHMDPKDAIQAAKDLKCKKSLGIHWGTFQLTNESINEPPTLLKELMSQKENKKLDFTSIENGESLRFNLPL